MDHILIIAFLIISLFALVIISVVKVALEREKDIYKNGLEVWGEVSRCVHSFDMDYDSKYHCYVKYIGNDGEEHEGLLNVRTNLPIGRKVQIRYLPLKYEKVVFVSQEIS